LDMRRKATARVKAMMTTAMMVVPSEPTCGSNGRGGWC
jgi:hypothetical protein